MFLGLKMLHGATCCANICCMVMLYMATPAATGSTILRRIELQYFGSDEHTYFVQCSTDVVYNGPMEDESMFAHVEQAFPDLAGIVEEVKQVGSNLIRFVATGTVYCEDLGALRDVWEDDYPDTRHLIRSVKNVVFDNELLQDVLHADRASTPRFVAPDSGEVAA